jgi:3-hydroxybutyryl-CoA dehydratase
MSHDVLKMPRDSDLYVDKSLSLEKSVTEDDIIHFGHLSLDFNPLHFSEQLAQKTRFKGRIVHGMLTASLFSGVLTQLTPWCVYLRQEIDFTAPVRIGDTVKTTGTITAITDKGVVTVALMAINQNGDMVLRGKAEMKKLTEMYLTDPPQQPSGFKQ